MPDQSMATLLAAANIAIEPFTLTVEKKVQGNSSTYSLNLRAETRFASGDSVVYNWGIEGGKPGRLVRKILRDVASGGMLSLLTSCSHTRRALLDGISTRESMIRCKSMDEAVGRLCPGVWPKARRMLTGADNKV